MEIIIIAAVAQNRVIGKDNTIPWRLPDDMKYFKEVTVGDSIAGNHVVMGRKNWESIPPKFRPLPGRINWVITRNKSYNPGVSPAGPATLVVHSLAEALQKIEPTLTSDQKCFIIGGGEIYLQAMLLATKLHITEIKSEPEGNVFFPEINKDEWVEVSRESHGIDEKHAYEFDFVVYERKKA